MLLVDVGLRLQRFRSIKDRRPLSFQTAHASTLTLPGSTWGRSLNRVQVS